ncbi:hypothetical protein FRZ67_03295 [Panacibacter ginsenosidivorans]|uniref:ABC transporter permease subunit n=1 Tax=Panacibacter ginsenosidivorans TaxID=1813871 RepID=A0A5B8V689_9BACT|nr:ABC transporter permease [Panacibacter ginsenosidivorans]QEC66373.1 hypothetical protein FRZ67_03295 [Panacibacter ginsenosidivorans]
MKSFLTSFQTEIIKIKNSFAVWLIILGAAFIPLFFFLHHIYDWDDYLPKPGENPWNEYFRKGFNGVHFTFLPLLIVLLVSLLLNIEHKSNTWKHIFVLPISKSKIFFSKYLLLVFLIVSFYFLLLIFFFGFAILLGLWKSDFNFFEYSPSYLYNSVQSAITSFVIRSFISTLAIGAIHFWLSFRLKNLFINIAIGLAGVVLAVSMYIPHWESIIYVPYAFPVLMCNYIPDAKNFLSDFQVNSLLYFLIISVLSYFDFTKLFHG